MNVTMDDAASERLFSASAMIADEDDRSPAISLIKAKMKLMHIPTMLDNVP